MANKKYPFSINGKIVKYEQANISLSSITCKYASSIFEGIRGYWRSDTGSMAVFALDQHLQRFFQSLKLMRMECFSPPNTVKKSVWDLIHHNNFQEDIYIRCACSISGSGPITTKGPTLISIHAFPQGRKEKSQKEGINVSISNWQRITDTAMPARIKCIANYHNSRLAMLQAEEDGYDNTIMLNIRGKIAEAPTACVFFVKENILYTPDTQSDILESLTRKFIIMLAKKNKLQVVEREIDRSEVYTCDEAFLCGTGCEILPIVSIDHYLLDGGKIGRITQLLKQSYFDEVYGKKNNFKEWFNVQKL